MENSDVFKNTVGAFLGGMLGILGAGFVHVALLGPACVVGVLLGWGYRDLYRIVPATVHRNADKARTRLSVGQARWSGRTRKALRHCFTAVCYFLAAIGVYFLLVWKIIYFAWLCLLWLIDRPHAIKAWVMASERHQIAAHQAAAFAVYVAVNALWLWPVSKWSVLSAWHAKKGDLSELLWLGAFLTVLSTLAAGLGSLDIQWDKRDGKYRRLLRRYRANSSGKFFRQELAVALCFEFNVVMLVLGMTFWALGFGGIFLMLVVVPISIVAGIIKGVYAVSMRSGYWLCLIVTLFVTSMSAWYTYGRLTDAQVIWAAALLTGVVAAVATEAVRRGLVNAFGRWQWLRDWQEKSLENRLLPLGQRFMRFSEQCAEQFFGLLPFPTAWRR